MNPDFPANAAPIKFYRHPLSGHCHRVEMMLSILDLPYELIEVDLLKGAHKAPEFLELNLFGQVPVIDDNGTLIADSNAILVYLVQSYGAETDWLPTTPKDAAEVQRWLSLTVSHVATGPSRARWRTLIGAGDTPETEAAREVSHDFLSQMEGLIAGRDYLVGDRPTIADVASYAYIAHAPEGGVSLDCYPLVRAWIERVAALPGFVPMVASSVPEPA
ncbi:glutathione S-transferase [Tritonibacter scottomollicae]|uniref:Glutathione S-transferase n=1 Tax=Tritonibacter scottomollicae TaxID=483013 RepID=A0ABZ0HAH8_TRISK|nr:glutathione S-transferase [Tritonibacter scottomollicae]WOI31466.1 glutathione S-transferase [Tritonibacter scottomollicae]